MELLVCRHTANMSYDSAGVRKHLATLDRIDPRHRSPVWRCPYAVFHPDRPYHVGHRQVTRRAA